MGPNIQKKRRHGLKRKLVDYIFLLTMAGFVVVLDQWSKVTVRANLDLGDIWAPWHWLIPYARILYIENSGAAFGIFQGMNSIFSILAVLVAIAIIYYFPQIPPEDWLIRFALCLQLGGALGNLIDRINSGLVTDFISVWIFPVFNIADASISVGTALLILGMLLKERKERQQQLSLEESMAEQLNASTPPPSEE